MRVLNPQIHSICFHSPFDLLDFDDDQRAATRKAAEMAGLKVLRLVNEPSAVALAYELGKDSDKDILSLVLHLGGGTSDVSLISTEDLVHEIVGFKADMHLGGQDFDDRVVNYLVEKHKKRAGQNLSSREGMPMLRTAVQNAKHALSSEQSVEIELVDPENGHVFAEMLSRAKFEQLNMDLFHRTMELVETVLKSVNVTRKQVDKVLPFFCSFLRHC